MNRYEHKLSQQTSQAHGPCPWCLLLSNIKQRQVLSQCLRSSDIYLELHVYLSIKSRSCFLSQYCIHMYSSVIGYFNWYFCCALFYKCYKTVIKLWWRVTIILLFKTEQEEVFWVNWWQKVNVIALIWWTKFATLYENHLYDLWEVFISIAWQQPVWCVCLFALHLPLPGLQL